MSITIIEDHGFKIALILFFSEILNVRPNSFSDILYVSDDVHMNQDRFSMTLQLLNLELKSPKSPRLKEDIAKIIKGCQIQQNPVTKKYFIEMPQAVCFQLYDLAAQIANLQNKVFTEELKKLILSQQAMSVAFADAANRTWGFLDSICDASLQNYLDNPVLMCKFCREKPQKSAYFEYCCEDHAYRAYTPRDKHDAG